MTDPATESGRFLTEAVNALGQEDRRYRVSLLDETDLETLHNLIIAAAHRSDLGVVESDQKARLKEAGFVYLITGVRIANTVTQPAATPIPPRSRIWEQSGAHGGEGSKYRHEPVVFLPVRYMTAQIVVKAFRARERIAPVETLDELQDIIVYAVKTAIRLTRPAQEKYPGGSIEVIDPNLIGDPTQIPGRMT